MSPAYEVDITEVRPKTWKVEADDTRAAAVKALRGEGEEVSPPYVEGEIVAIRRIEEES